MSHVQAGFLVVEVGVIAIVEAIRCVLLRGR